MFQNLSARQPALEEMDRPDIDPGALEAALRSLKRINAVGNGVGIFWPELRRLLATHPGPGPLRVLDVGCGAGDMSWRLERKARRAGLAIQVDGCDLSPVAIAMARRERDARGGQGEFYVCDAVEGPLPGNCDVVISSLFLHHLEHGDAVRVLSRMASHAGQAVLVSDLVRSRLGLLLVYVATRLLSSSSMVYKDGVTSLCAAYTVPEVRRLLEEAGLGGARIVRRWPERFLLTWRRPGTVPPGSPPKLS